MNYSEALKGDAPIIMGCVLRPLSLGALIHLFNERSAVVDIKRPLLESSDAKEWVKWAIEEMKKALLICAMTFEDYRELQRSPNKMRAEMKRFDKVILRLTWEKQFDLFNSIWMFNEYLNEGFEIPPHTPIRVGKSDIPQSTPNKDEWYHPFLLELAETLNKTETEILNRSFTLTKKDHYGIAAKKGAIALKGDQEKNLMEECLKAFR
jgi:hypothetical protein